MKDSDGKIAECDTPDKLMQKDSIFKHMMISKIHMGAGNVDSIGNSRRQESCEQVLKAIK